MDNKNITKIICYLDGGDVCGFVFVVASLSAAAAAAAAAAADASFLPPQQ